MSEQIQTELRTYMSYLDTRVAPMTIDEMTELRFGTESVRPIGLQAQSVDLRPRRRWLVAAGARVGDFVEVASSLSYDGEGLAGFDGAVVAGGIVARAPVAFSPVYVVAVAAVLGALVLTS